MRICITLIRNNDRSRYKHIRPALDLLKSELSSSFDVEIFEVFKQPKVIPTKTLMTLLRKCLLWNISREWNQYRSIKPRNIIFDIVILIRRLALTYINRDQENKRSIIDTFVTDKHIRAWDQFLEKEADFLICFEDDAVFKTTSISNLKKFLRGIKKYSKKLIYLDLAGGCSPETIKVGNLEFKSDEYRKYYRKPVTNTACCYMISRPTAEVFFPTLIRHPWLRLISVDWLLNKLFILTTSQYDYYCYHAYPPIFNHGSITGNYLSWLDSPI